jgi:tetratricopeptide (TPR) repeat protein
MPMIVPRAACWLGIAAVVVGLGGAAVWMGSRTGPDLVTQGRSAYSERDWDRAADLVRKRLRASPGDLEALRLLARASARLGRDGPANALFARLGSDALDAEDLFLVGLGLNRAGQQEPAGRLWEKAVRLNPDHAESIEQLIIRYTARNRLAEAAALAERLARLPGWELRGELDLGALRDELSDPAGAATVLGRALGRPEAASLDRPMSDRYRKLLARTLLKTDRAGDARAVLSRILDERTDPEASWLLSRAALLDGSVAESTAALEAAGTYRAEHPLEAEPSPFVGEARCADCHADTSHALKASRHASTLVRGDALRALPYPSQPFRDPDDAAVTHMFRQEAGQVRMETRVEDEVLRAVVDYAFGSPERYVSLVGRDDHDRPHILRISRYHTGKDAGWVRTTGHSADVAGPSDFLGKSLDPVDGVLKCLFCHATNPKSVLDRSGPESQDRAIGCERCHGPGAIHVKAVAAKFPDPAIVSPADAPAEGRLRLCGQCHSHHQELPLPRTDPYWIRFQGTTLPWSRCYTESAGSMDCMTCHDPHHDTERSEAHYTARCLSCHSPGNPAAPEASRRKSVSGTDRAVRGAVCPVNPTKGCVGCHMPPFESPPLHATFADHYIRVHPRPEPRRAD